MEESVFVSGEELVNSILCIPELCKEVAFLVGVDKSDVVAEGISVMGGLPDFLLSSVDVESVSNHSSRVLEESDFLYFVHSDPFSSWFVSSVRGEPPHRRPPKGFRLTSHVLQCLAVGVGLHFVENFHGIFFGCFRYLFDKIEK